MKQIYHLMMIYVALFSGIMSVNAQKSLDELKEWDKYFFTKGQQFEFTTSNNVSQVTVNDRVVSMSNFKFSTELVEGINTIKIYEKVQIQPPFPVYGNRLKKTYSLKAESVDYNINNGEVVKAGDIVTIVFNELGLPVAKSETRNPKDANLLYETDIPGLGKISGNNATPGGSTSFNSANLNTLTLTIPADAVNGDVYTLTNGHVYQTWFGNKLFDGQSKKDYGGFWGEAWEYNFYTLPDITITVGQSNNQGEADVITVIKPLSDIEVVENAYSSLLPLSDVFSSKQGQDISFNIESNSNNGLVTAIIENKQLKLLYTEEKTGQATIKIKASTWRASATDEIIVTVNEKPQEEPIKVINYNFGYNSNTVGDDWKNDLWLNSYSKEMTPGETYNIVARRVEEIVSSSVTKDVVLPTFTYTIVSGNSVRVNESGKITAIHSGPSIIEVSYLEKQAYGRTYPACSSVNKTYMCVDVVDDKNSGLSINTNIDDAMNTYHTYYFTEDYYNYSFTAVSSDSDNLIVKCNGVDASKKGNQYTVQLKNRANIIEIKAEKDDEFKRKFFVVDARKIEIEKSNVTDPDQDFEPGDKIRVSFKGITMPVYKLATIYNPCFKNAFEKGSDFARVVYQNDIIGNIHSNVNIGQYTLANNNTIEITLPNSGVYTFKGGHIHSAWWGSDLGTEKTMTGPGSPNLNAIVQQSDFSFLPDFTIEVKGYMPVTFEDQTLSVESERYADATAVEVYQSVNEVFKSGSFNFKNSATNWGSMTSWYGVALSNRTDNTTSGGVSNQFNSAAGGDINGTGKYAVVYDANSGGLGLGPDAAISFTNVDYPDGKEVSGLYITNNTYATNSLGNGDGFAKPFGGDDGNDEDWFKLTAEGFDKDGETTGTVDFYMADYRFENNTKDYIVKDWEWMDLSSLGTVTKVQFTMTSTDVGGNGMNTPAYFCMDNINQPRLLLKNSIDDITVEPNAGDQLIDLSNLFEDTENADISKDIVYNTNTDLVTATINGDELKLEFAEGTSGTAEIMLKGKCQKMAARTSFTVTVSTPTAIEKEAQESAVSVYPNPFNDQITIKGAHLKGAQYMLYSISGQMVKQGYLNQSPINTSDLLKGTYLLRIQSEAGVVTQKLLKQ
jgi:hypothetical protein